MPDIAQDPLTAFSEALSERAGRSQPLAARVAMQGRWGRSGTLWRKDVVVASEQTFPDVAEATVTLADGTALAARLAGRDPGTNVVALRLDGAPDTAAPPAGEPHLGALVLAFSADSEGVSMRLGIVRSVGPAWHSRAGGRIDRRITLDVVLTGREEGGPVFDAGGGLLGMSTLGPRGRVLVIPGTTIDRVLEPLLTKGRVERGWLGLSLQSVLVPEVLHGEAGQARGLMVVGVAKDGPGAQAGILSGDILLAVGGDCVTSAAKVAEHLGPEAIGQSAALRLIRAGRVVSLDATVAARPSG